MDKSVEVTLAIKVAVDDSHSHVDHAHDIILMARKTFPAATVKVVKIWMEREPKQETVHGTSYQPD